MEDDLIIDAEFRDLLPESRKDEDDGLEASVMMTGGPLEPIYVWKQQGIIVDGHRRYAICRKHNLPFKRVELEFDNREHVIAWMRSWQCDRRNLTPLEVKNQRGQLATWMVANGATTGKAVSVVASQFRVSERTVKRDVSLARDMADMPAEVAQYAAKEDLPATVVSILASLEPIEQTQIVAEAPSRDALIEAVRKRPEAPKPLTVKPGKAAAFHKLAKKCRDQLGVTQRLVADLAQMVPNSHADLRDVKRMLGDCDVLVQTWITVYDDGR